MENSKVESLPKYSALNYCTIYSVIGRLRIKTFYKEAAHFIFKFFSQNADFLGLSE